MELRIRVGDEIITVPVEEETELCFKYLNHGESTCGRLLDHLGRCQTSEEIEQRRAYGRAYAAANKEKQRQRHLNARAPRQNVMDEKKLTTGCENCGFGKHENDWRDWRWQAVALDLDHSDPTQKTYNMSRLAYPSRCSDTEFLAELGKCRVLCASCHRIKTHHPERLTATWQ